MIKRWRYITITLNFNNFSLKGLKLEWFLCLCLMFLSFFFLTVIKLGNQNMSITSSSQTSQIHFLKKRAPKCAMRTSYYYIWVKNIGEAGLLC